MPRAILSLVLFSFLPMSALADAIVTTRVIRPGQVITAADLSVVDADIPGTMTEVSLVEGQEARVVIYPGRPIKDGQVGPPARVVRNQIVKLTYLRGGLAISTEGRALDRGSVGDVVPVINSSSRNTVQGRIMPDGSVQVSLAEG